MADVYSAIILDTDYWDGAESWAGETSEANRDSKYSTRRFTSCAAWEADRDGNSSLGDNEYGIISGAWASADSSQVVITGWTAGVTGILLQCPLTLPDGDNTARHNGIIGNKANSHKIEYAETSSMINMGFSNITLDGLQLHNTVTDDSNVNIMSDGAYTGLVIRNCVLSTCAGTGTGNGINLNNASITATIENCITTSPHEQISGSEGIYCDAVSTCSIYNCVVYNYNDGIEIDAGTVTIKNCISFSNADDIDGTATIDYCATDDGDGTNAVDWDAGATDWAANFEGYATEDLRPKNVDLPGAGIGPDSDANVPTTDIIGNSRSGNTCTIGAFEYVAAGGATREISGSLPSMAGSLGRKVSLNRAIGGLI